MCVHGHLWSVPMPNYEKREKKRKKSRLLRFEYILFLLFLALVQSPASPGELPSSITTMSSIHSCGKANKKRGDPYSSWKRTRAGRWRVADLCPPALLPAGYGSRRAGRGRDRNCCGGEGGVLGYSVGGGTMLGWPGMGWEHVNERNRRFLWQWQLTGLFLWFWIFYEFHFAKL